MSAGAEEAEEAEEAGEPAPTIDVRQVTQVHARWAEEGDGVPGTFVLSVILDDGAQEIVARPSAHVLQAALPLIRAAGDVVVDLSRGVVAIGSIEIATG